MKRKVKKFSEGDRVYDREDEGLLGAKIKYREEDGRKYTAGKANPFDRDPQEQRYYSVDDIKGKLSGLFGGSSEDSKSFSKFRDLESVGGPNRRPRTIEEQIGPKAEPKADAEKPIRKFADYNKTGAQRNVSKDEAPYEVEKAEPPKTSGGSGSGSKSSSSTKTSSSASKAAENKYKPNEDRKSKPYPKDARPLKPVPKAEEDAEGDRGKSMDIKRNLEEEVAARLKKNKSVAFKEKDDDPTDKIIDKTVKDTSGAKTVYSDKPFSFTKNLQDKKDKEKKSSSADDRYKTYKETNAKYQKMLDSYKNKKDDDSKVSAADKSVKSFKNPAREVPEDKGAKKAINKAKSGSVGRMPGSKFDMDDPNAMSLGSGLDPKSRLKEARKRIPEKKTGGAIKNMAKGGSASSRGDGIAARGKTRGRIC